MDNTALEKRLAQLEFENEQLRTELIQIDMLLRSIGFPDGLASAKQVAEEMLEELNREEEQF